MEVAVVEEREIGLCVREGDELLEVLVGEVFEGKLDVVGVKEELCKVLEFEDV